MKKLFIILLCSLSATMYAQSVDMLLSKIYVNSDGAPKIDDYPVGIAYIGNFSNINELKSSKLYPQIEKLYPALKNISKIEVDLGTGSIYLLDPQGLSTLAINEYDMDMFLGNKDESEGMVLYRTETPKPILVRGHLDEEKSINIIGITKDGGKPVKWAAYKDAASGLLRTDEADFLDLRTTYDMGINPGDEAIPTGNAPGIRIYANGMCMLDSYQNGKLRCDFFQYMGKEGVDAPADQMPIVNCFYMHDDMGRQGVMKITCSYVGNQRYVTLTPIAGENFGLDKPAKYKVGQRR